ncbi:MAG: thiamine ABC transporter substrate-binding protein [Candidatus Hodarchaeales archaeon]|jgi:thiamine transport system substrate-binding protein
MKRNLNLFIILTSLILIYGLNRIPLTTTSSHISSPEETQLVIYTYDSLLNDPYFNIEGNFSDVSGIPESQIQIIRFNDANELIVRLEAEKSNPIADVVIGIDNTLIHLIEDKASVLEPYSPIPTSQIDENLIQNLDSEQYLTPYDYGIISLYYQNQIINSSTNPELENLTLEALLTSNLLPMLIVENPKYSSPGLGFLLWTIAVYGDPEVNFDGLLNSNWRNWWNASRDKITITNSWGDAFNIFFTPEEGKPIMVSYGTSPAYSYCQWVDNSTSAVVTHEEDQQNGWLQIEGIGLVKDASHKEKGKQFIDWFLSPSLQSEIPGHQWMYPANKEVVLSPCFEESVIHPDEVFRLNDLLSPQLIGKYLPDWKDQWEQVVVLGYFETGGNIPSFEIVSSLLGLIIVAIPMVLKKKKRR